VLLLIATVLLLLCALYDQVLLVVNHMIFLKGLSFSNSQSGPQERTLRPNPGGPVGAGRAKGSGLSFFSEDSHNVILDALGVNDAGGE
jgi:hypothetical protein